MNGEYKVGTNIQFWRNDVAQTITFIVTEDCNQSFNFYNKYSFYLEFSSNRIMITGKLYRNNIRFHQK